MADTIGIMGVPSLCTLGKLYICGEEEYLKCKWILEEENYRSNPHPTE